MESKRFLILLLRGLLGGAVGGFILAAWSVIGQVELFQRNWEWWLAIIYFLYALPYGLSVGGITTIAIWLIHRYTQVNLGPAIRTTIGVVIGITVLWFMTSKTENVTTSRLHQLLAFVLFGMCIGGLPGLFVGRQSHGRFRGRP